MDPKELLEDVRNYLDITWADEAGDQKLLGIIARGANYLQRWAGAELDFSEEALPRSLLFDYCRYVRSGALDDFRVNYLHELIGLQMEEGVKRSAGEQSAELQ